MVRVRQRASKSPANQHFLLSELMKLQVGGVSAAGEERAVCRAFALRAASSFAPLAAARSHQGRTRSRPGRLPGGRGGRSARALIGQQLQDAADALLEVTAEGLLVRVTAGGRPGPPSASLFAPTSASVERERCALPAAPGIAFALCGSVHSCSSQDVNRRPWTAHNPKLRYGASRARAPRSGGRAQR
jgi:hypothetical protein